MWAIPQVSKNTITTLGSYLAGLIEGDGSIIIPTKLKNSANKLQFPIIKIPFPTKDLPFFELLVNVIGGKIQNTTGDYKIWAVQNKESLIKIIVLINGQMRTPKIEALYRLIDWVNSYGKLHEGPINKLPLDQTSLLSNSWLAGFIEADGHFYCSFELNKDSLAVDMHRYMSISQRQVYHRESEFGISYEPIMINIQQTLNAPTLTKINRDRGKSTEQGYLVRISSKDSCQSLINYFNIYPLWTTKYLDFIDWHKFHKLKSDKGQFLEKTQQVIAIKNSMNNRRTNFNWEHLKSFYTLD